MLNCTVCNCISIHHLKVVDAPWVWVGRSQSGLHIWTLQLHSIPLRKTAQALSGCRDRAWTALFTSSNIFSFGFRSWPLLGRSRTFTLLRSNYFCGAFAVCFGSLSCLKINFLPSRSSLAAWIRPLRFAALILPSTFTSRLLLRSIRQHDAPCFTWGWCVCGDAQCLVPAKHSI